MKQRQNDVLNETYASITLKGVCGRSFEAACHVMRSVIGVEDSRVSFLLESGRLTQDEKKCTAHIRGNPPKLILYPAGIGSVYVASCRKS